jgi:hypothetical protein
VPGGFLAGLALQIAQDDDGTILVGQAAQLLVEQGLQVTPEVLPHHPGFGHLHHLPLPHPPPGGQRLRLEGRVGGDPVQPVGQQRARRDGSGLAGQDEEGGLERILGVVVVAEGTAADAPDQRAVPAHEGREGGFIAVSHETLQQVFIGHASPVPQQRGCAQVLDDPAHPAGRHAHPPGSGPVVLYLSTSRTGAV